MTIRKYPTGSTIEHRDDGKTFVWYPPVERVTVTLVVPPACSQCGQVMSEPEASMVATVEELPY